MMNFSQGDIIKISNLKDAMLVVSKNEFIKKTEPDTWYGNPGSRYCKRFL